MSAFSTHAEACRKDPPSCVGVRRFTLAVLGLQVKAVKVCNSAKFGVALVIETSPQSGGYVLGFKVDPRETLDYVHKELSSLLQVCGGDVPVLLRPTCNAPAGNSSAQLRSYQHIM